VPICGLTSTALLGTLNPGTRKSKASHEQSDNTVFFEIMTALEVVMLATSVLIAFATICATATYAACWVSNGISGRDYW
jgi:hypothetical protein